MKPSQETVTGQNTGGIAVAVFFTLRKSKPTQKHINNSAKYNHDGQSKLTKL